MRRKILSILTIGMLLLDTACGDKQTSAPGSDEMLVQVGDSALMLRDVLSRIPSGLSPEDSTEMFNTIVNTWVRRMVLSDLAEKNIPDMQKIEDMVESYRDGLIVDRYLELMDAQREPGEDEQRIKTYYQQHGEELVLKEPIVQGIFLKTPSDDESAGQLREWMRRANADAIDKIEKRGLKHALQYDVFLDRWIPWHRLAQQIPYRFFDADAFVESQRDFETEYAGSLYLLHISKYVPSGQPMPYDYAREVIAGILRRSDLTRSREQLLRDIYRDQMKEGVLKTGSFDPIAGKMKQEQLNQKNQK